MASRCARPQGCQAFRSSPSSRRARPRAAAGALRPACPRGKDRKPKLARAERPGVRNSGRRAIVVRGRRTDERPDGDPTAIATSRRAARPASHGHRRGYVGGQTRTLSIHSACRFDSSNVAEASGPVDESEPCAQAWATDASRVERRTQARPRPCDGIARTRSQGLADLPRGTAEL